MSNGKEVGVSSLKKEILMTKPKEKISKNNVLG
jgi:hypothetical protein